MKKKQNIGIYRYNMYIGPVYLMFLRCIILYMLYLTKKRMPSSCLDTLKVWVLVCIPTLVCDLSHWSYLQRPVWRQLIGGRDVSTISSSNMLAVRNSPLKAGARRASVWTSPWSETQKHGLNMVPKTLRGKSTSGSLGHGFCSGWSKCHTKKVLLFRFVHWPKLPHLDYLNTNIWGGLWLVKSFLQNSDYTCSNSFR